MPAHCRPTLDRFGFYRPKFSFASGVFRQNDASAHRGLRPRRTDDTAERSRYVRSRDLGPMAIIPDDLGFAPRYSETRTMRLPRFSPASKPINA
jgi:hypothetical protein